MMRTLIILAAVFTLSACQLTGGGDQKVVTNEATGLTKQQSELLSAHNQELVIEQQNQSVLKKLIANATEYQSKADLAQSRLKAKRSTNTTVIAMKTEENVTINQKHLALQKLKDQLYFDTDDVKKLLAESEAREKKINEAIRVIDDESAVTGEDLVVDGVVQYPRLLNPNELKELENTWREKFSENVNGINRLLESTK
jgi:hypothetical protein